MPTSGSGSEPREIRLTEELDASTRETPPSPKESAWETFQANLKQRRQRVQSQSSSSARVESYESTAKSSNKIAYENVPRIDDEEESKFGKSLIGLMQRSGRFDYCDFRGCEQTQLEYSDDNNQSINGSVRRVMKISAVRLDLNKLNRTWRNLANQAPRFIRKALGSSSPR